jgi:hypothetical protein
MSTFRVGQAVMVHMAGFSHRGVQMGEGAWVGGQVIAFNGVRYTVKLGAVIAGVDTVEVEAHQLQAA